MKNNIYKIAFECKKIADQQIEVIRTIIPRGNIIYTDYTVNGNIKGYEQKLLCLKDAMKDKYPELCFQMQEHMDKYDTDNIVHLSALEAIVNSIIALEGNIVIEEPVITKRDVTIKKKKIFISHKSEDKPFVDALVNLLRLYIGSDTDKIFCSSVPNYKIGLGKEIYPEIKAQFDEFDVFMIIIHSPLYYQSPICLNEMGASWILDTKCCSFLTANCKYDDLKGTIDRQYVSIKVNGDDVKDRMNEFICKVLEYFELPQIEMLKFSQWEADRDKFIKEVCNF